MAANLEPVHTSLAEHIALRRQSVYTLSDYVSSRSPRFASRVLGT